MMIFFVCLLEKPRFGGGHEEMDDIPPEEDEFNPEAETNPDNENEGREEFDTTGDGIQILPLNEDGTVNPNRGSSKEIKQKMTTRYMTKYERARVLGTRALQIRYLHS